jgi:hypothetical protein
VGAAELKDARAQVLTATDPTVVLRRLAEAFENFSYGCRSLAAAS